MNKVEISVIIPIYNEEQNIHELYTRLKNTIHKITNQYEFIFINDGSKDSSLSQIKTLGTQDSNVKFISFSRNFGHQVATTAGLNYSVGKAIVIIDGDLQDPPELISEFYQKYKEGYKVVFAKRIARKGETFLKKITARLFYRLLAKLTSINIPIDAGDFRIMDRLVVEYLKKMPEANKFLRGQIAWIGFRQTFVEYERNERKFGKSGYPLRKMIRLALDGITAFSNTPLKIASVMGFIVSIFSLIVILYALYSKFVLHQVITGWTSLIISSMFIGGIQLFSIGIIGEYISRINVEVKKRPLYIIEESNFDSIETLTNISYEKMGSQP